MTFSTLLLSSTFLTFFGLKIGCMEKIRDTVKEIFTAYLDRKGLRKTPERYAILDEIYSHSGHFGVDTLFKRMADKNYRVSKATLYNTMELLLESELIVKHTYKDEMAQYERAMNLHHEHLICRECNKVVEFSDERIDEVLRRVEEEYGFEVRQHRFYVYGRCKNCKLKMSKKKGNSL